jgi:hypothetical protein
MNVNDYLKAVADASPTQGGNYFRDGRYRLVVERLLCEAKTGGVFFIGEFRVLEAQATEKDVTPNQPGSTVSVAYNLSKTTPPGSDRVAQGNAKSLIAAILGGLGYTEDQVGQAEMNTAVDKSQPLRGAVIEAATYKKTSRSGKELVLPRFGSVTQTADDIKAMRAKLDGGSIPANPTPAPATPAPVATGMLASLGIKQ